MEKMKLSKAVELVENSISSIFNKQDVLALLGSIDTEPDMENIKEVFDKVKVNFAHGLRCAEEGIIDKDNIELELNGNEISVYRVEADLEHIESVLEEVLDDLEIYLENN
jgi:coenzyme F420-reducing hydrogenase gamma subunit